MANDALIDLLAWSRRERESLQMQREMLLSGKFRIFKDEGSGGVDVSTDSIARLTDNIAELDQILKLYRDPTATSKAIPVDQLNASNDE
jgi:ABC-type phosphonate transport system ATPase subunit